MHRLDRKYKAENFDPYDDYYVVRYHESNHSEILHSPMNENDRRNVGRWATILKAPKNFSPKGEVLKEGDEVLVEKHKGYYIEYLGFPKDFMLVRYKRFMAIREKKQ